MLNLSSIRIQPVIDPNHPHLKAFVSMLVNDVLFVDNVKIIDSGKRLFVAMPSERRKNGKYMDLVYPANKEIREKLESEIISAYNTIVKGVYK